MFTDEQVGELWEAVSANHKMGGLERETILKLIRNLVNERQHRIWITSDMPVLAARSLAVNLVRRDPVLAARDRALKDFHIDPTSFQEGA